MSVATDYSQKETHPNKAQTAYSIHLFHIQILPIQRSTFQLIPLDIPKRPQLLIHEFLSIVIGFNTLNSCL